MARYLTLFTLVPSVFTFIAVILINIGGISSIHPFFNNSSLTRERNTPFNLLNWRFRILSPDNSSREYIAHLYLHRICSTVIAGFTNPLCRSTRALSDRTAWTPNTFLNRLRPSIFDTVNLNVSFAFYVLAAICAFLLIFWAFAAFSTKGRMVRITGVVVSTAGFISVLVASSVLTWQITKLKRQISNDSRRSALGPSTSTGTSGSTDRNIYTISLGEVKLGRTVMGLTWTAVGLMLGCTILWVASLLKDKKEKKARKNEKEERLADDGRV